MFVQTHVGISFPAFTSQSSKAGSSGSELKILLAFLITPSPLWPHTQIMPCAHKSACMKPLQMWLHCKAQIDTQLVQCLAQSVDLAPTRHTRAILWAMLMSWPGWTLVHWWGPKESTGGDLRKSLDLPKSNNGSQEGNCLTSDLMAGRNTQAHAFWCPFLFLSLLSHCCACHLSSHAHEGGQWANSIQEAIVMTTRARWIWNTCKQFHSANILMPQWSWHI